MAKQETRYVITHARALSGRSYTSEPLTLAEAIRYYGYTLECGESWQHETGNKKINRNPKSIKSLITNLNNASSNTATNGWGERYTYVEA